MLEKEILMRDDIKARIAKRMSGSSAPSKDSEIEINLIDDNPFQPRLDYDDALIDELANSIESEGLLQPVPVTKKGDRYVLIAGHRRLRAFKALEREKIPVVVHGVKTDRELLFLSAIENLRRVDLNIIEEALAYNRMADAGLKNKEIAKGLGVGETEISRTRNLLKLSAVIIKDIQDNQSTSDITALSFLRKIENEEKQISLYREFLINGREWLSKAVKEYLGAVNEHSANISLYEKHVKVSKRKIEVSLADLDEEKREKIIDFLQEELK